MLSTTFGHLARDTLSSLTIFSVFPSPILISKIML